jgi:NADPH-dependent 2,4-dienoyl-CoA reductase/sulfur reductase-like enzyme
LLPRTSLRAVERGRVARLDSGDAIDADLVLLATGMRPNCALAEAAGLEVAHGRVRTDDGMRTSAPGVLAAGDVALAHNAAAGRALPVEHWGEAETMGSIAGRQAAGEPAHWANAPGFWSVLGERVLKYASWDDGFDRSEVVHHADGGFTVWYGNRGTVVGVLTHEADEDYARGTELIEAHAAFPRTG